MLFDTFMFRDELDMLEFRLAHMAGYDVRHVMVEATRTHRGEPKALVYEEQDEAWLDQWDSDRVVRLTCDHLPDETDSCFPWAREHHQRDCAQQYIREHAAPDDLVLIADVDEIPDMERIAAVPAGQPATLHQRCFSFAVDWEFADEQPTSLLVPAKLLNWAPLSLMRDQRHGYPVQDHAGWHFSWLGGNDAILTKVNTHCHTEFNDELRRCLADGLLYEKGHSIWGNELRAVDVDETWPEWIRERRCPASWFRPRGEA